MSMPKTLSDTSHTKTARRTYQLIDIAEPLTATFISAVGSG
ncbi:MAG: hypothetical protein OXI54_02525 [Chloroflexota bacterium]|nr:hypothetical protein [Chloroflexota bacterium]MDE2683011.1 hypothetical protein [Chloroflexota bacterium]